MKRNKLFSLLCVALGATTLLAGCGGENSTKTGNFTDEDFVKTSYKVERTYYHEYGDTHTNLNLNKEYGEFVEENSGAILFRKTDKDFMNNVVDIYTLYNIYSGKVVWTHESKYEDIDKDAVDEYGHRKYPETVERVYANSFGVTVATTTYTRLDDEVIEENELDFSYTDKTHYAFYDVNGKKVTESEINGKVEVVRSNYGQFGLTQKVLFGGTTVGVYERSFEDDSYQLVKTYKASTQEATMLYDYQTSKYGYMLNDGVEIYDRASGALKYSYYYDTGMSGMFGGGSNASVLNNGDVLVQYVEMTSDKNADVYIEMYGIGMNMYTEIISVENGARKQIDCEYMFEMVETRSLLESMIKAGNVQENMQIEIGDSLINCGMGVKLSDVADMMISGGNMEENLLAVFFDNNGKVQHVMGAEAFMFSDEDVQPLSDGSYLKDIETPLVSANGAPITQAIYAADGTLRSYLPENAAVVDDFVVIAGVGIYDYDMKQLCAWDNITQISSWKNWEIVGVTGDNVMVKGWDDNGTTEYHLVGKYTAARFGAKYVSGVSGSGAQFHYEFHDTYVKETQENTSGDINAPKATVTIYNTEMEALIHNLSEWARVYETKNALVIIDEGDVYRIEAQQSYPTNYLPELSDKVHDEDGNGIPDWLDDQLRDWNDNGIPDCYEGYGGEDSNGDGIPDDFDKNDNGVDDRLDEWK